MIATQTMLVGQFLISLVPLTQMCFINTKIVNMEEFYTDVLAEYAYRPLHKTTFHNPQLRTTSLFINPS